MLKVFLEPLFFKWHEYHAFWKFFSAKYQQYFANCLILAKFYSYKTSRLSRKQTKNKQAHNKNVIDIL